MRERSQWRLGSAEWLALVTLAVGGSFLFGTALLAPRITLAQKQRHGVNELTLAGLRPGRDSRDSALKKLGKPWNLPLSSGNQSVGEDWLEVCSGSLLHVEFDTEGVIQTMEADFHKNGAVVCDEKRPNWKMPWPTGHGVRLGDLESRVISIYGKPGSVSPSTKNGRELELLYYAFDWAGPDVPQVLEIACDHETGRVVEIMLAFPSL